MCDVCGISGVWGERHATLNGLIARNGGFEGAVDPLKDEEGLGW